MAVFVDITPRLAKSRSSSSDGGGVRQRTVGLRERLLKNVLLL